MPNPYRIAIAVLLWVIAAGAVAQDDGDEASTLDRIEVTGSRLSYEDLLATPAISIRRPGDYLLQTVVLSNDSRDESVRRPHSRWTARSRSKASTAASNGSASRPANCCSTSPAP